MNKINSAVLYVVILVVVLIVILYFTALHNEGFGNTGALIQMASSEAFGMSPGTMVQLSSTRVVSREDEEIDNKIHANLTRKGIIDMTESGFNDS